MKLRRRRRNKHERSSDRIAQVNGSRKGADVKVGYGCVCIDECLSCECCGLVEQEEDVSVGIGASRRSWLTEFGDGGGAVHEEAALVVEIPAQEVSDLRRGGSLRRGCIRVYRSHDERSWSYISNDVERRRASGVIPGYLNSRVERDGRACRLGKGNLEQSGGFEGDGHVLRDVRSIESLFDGGDRDVLRDSDEGKR